MEATPVAAIPLSRMHESLDARLQGRISRKKLLAFLEWQMAVADERLDTSFRTEVQASQDLDAGLVNGVTRTY